MNRPLVIIESPLSPKNGRTMDENLLYLRSCLLDSWNSGELPFASHGFFPLFLNELDPKQRQEGIEAGYQFWNFIAPLTDTLSTRPLIAFYTDWGMSEGMNAAFKRTQDLGMRTVFRTILGV